MTARDLYDRLRYELAPVAVTTVGPCSEGCGRSARGSGMCVACLAAKLHAAVPEVVWAEFIRAMNASREHILKAEAEIFS